MRAVPLFLFALLLIAPASLVGGNAGAEAASRKGSQARKPAKKKASAKKPEIKLRETPGTSSDSEANPQASAPPQRGPTRIDFDDRLVQGQTNRSGSVYLYDRKELKTRSMVKKRESFREQIVDAVYE